MIKSHTERETSMTYSINIIHWFALAAGCSTRQQWLDWAAAETDDFYGDIAKYQKIPMMAARRMSVPSRLAVESALQLIEAQDSAIDAAIFISRHGELERTYKIVHSLAQQNDLSPTDFAMSVHNTAAGLFTITAQQPLPITSLAAGIDGFQQGMLEAQAMFANGAKRILLIDFDGLIPNAYHNAMENKPDDLCYAVGFIIDGEQRLICRQVEQDASLTPQRLPQSLIFLRNWLNGKNQFVVQGVRSNWQWNL
jgi:hypothetical protein